MEFISLPAVRTLGAWMLEKKHCSLTTYVRGPYHRARSIDAQSFQRRYLTYLPARNNVAGSLSPIRRRCYLLPTTAHTASLPWACSATRI